MLGPRWFVTLTQRFPCRRRAGLSHSRTRFPFIPAELNRVLMVPLHSNASESQESLGCQGKQKSSLHTHSFLKIVSSNLLTSHLSVLSFFSCPLCSALPCWGAGTLQSFLLFQKYSAANYSQPHDVITGKTTCETVLESLDHSKFSHSRT